MRLVLLAFLVPLVACRAASRTEPHMLVLNAGEYGTFDEVKSSRLGAEYRFGEHGRWKLIPAVGLARSEEGASFVFFELMRNLWFTESTVLTPSAGFGYFDGSDTLDLGSPLEFRTGLELSWRFENDWHLGIALFHLSNSSIADFNPGTEAVVVTLGIPVFRPGEAVGR